MKIKQFILAVILIQVITFLPQLLHAQPPSFSDDVLDADAPVDGGLGLLIAGGVGYGVKKLRQMRNKAVS
jgi:hypothetical protein